MPIKTGLRQIILESFTLKIYFYGNPGYNSPQKNKNIMSLKQIYTWLSEVIPAFPRKQSKTMDLCAIESKPVASLVVPYDENLLERSRTQWQFGDWQSLSQLDREAIQHHPDRAKLALLSAAAHQQTGDMTSARQLTRLAREWGCNKKLISQILIAGVHNTLGKASAIAGKQQQAFDHFKSSITMVNSGSDLRLLTQASVQSQLEKIIVGNSLSTQQSKVLRTNTHSEPVAK